MKIVSLLTKTSFERIMTPAHEKELKTLGEYAGGYLEGSDLKQAALAKLKKTGGADIILGCWGTPKLDPEIVAAAGKLKLYAYGAGSIKSTISKELIAGGVHATTAAPAIGIGVAEYAMSQIYTFSKKIPYYRVRSLDEYRNHKGTGMEQHVFEIHGHNVGIVGAGFVGRQMIRLLKAYSVNILVYDPFLKAETAAELGVAKVDDLVELAKQSMVFTLHAPSIPSTNNMINAAVLKALPDGALLVNTARGSLIDEAALIAELKTGRIYACLDVTEPEPPAADSPFFTLENCFLTPHIAGCVAENYKRQGDTVVAEVKAFTAGKKLISEITIDKYDIMA